MQNNTQKNQSDKTAADKTMDAFVEWMAKEMYCQYGLGTRENNLDGQDAKKLAWRKLHKWTSEKENFVINSAKMYIRLLDPKDPNSTNLLFIKALTNRMSKYLSLFLEGAPNRSRSQSEKILKNMLYTENQYIRGLELYQKVNRTKSRTPQSIAEKHKRDRINARKAKRNMEIQVRILFNEAAYKNR